eukprot:gene13213-14503_t
MANSSIPSNITCEDQVFDLDFHPTSSILAAGLITGKVELWDYTSHKNTRQSSLPIHSQSCRALAFNPSGNRLFTISSDLSWKIVDPTTGIIIQTKKSAHKHAINKLIVLNEQLFVTGDDNGVVKLWDSRIHPNYLDTMTWDAHSDYITDFDYAEDQHTILSTGGDATLCVYDIRNQQHFYKSDDQESEFHCLKIMKNGRRVYCGSQEGPIVIFKWDEWADCNDRFIDHTDGVECMIKVDELTMITGSIDSSIRLVSLQPKHKIEGVIGDLGGMSVEGLKLQRERSLLASLANDEVIRFWDVSEILDNDNDGEGDDAASSSSDIRHQDSLSEGEDDEGNSDDGSNSGDENDDNDVENPVNITAGSDEDEEEEEEEGDVEGNEVEEAGEESENESNVPDDKSDSDKDSDEDSDEDSEDSDRRPKKRIKTAREKFYADM